jgi:hypothetical protein
MSILFHGPPHVDHVPLRRFHSRARTRSCMRCAAVRARGSPRRRWPGRATATGGKRGLSRHGAEDSISERRGAGRGRFRDGRPPESRPRCAASCMAWHGGRRDRRTSTQPTTATRRRGSAPAWLRRARLSARRDTRAARHRPAQHDSGRARIALRFQRTTDNRACRVCSFSCSASGQSNPVK